MENHDPINLGTPGYFRIAERLRNDIIDGNIRPGQRLKTAELSKRYATSQIPIREALQALQGEGLIAILPNRGAVVRTVDTNFIANHYQVRIALETMMAKEAVRRVTDTSLANIKLKAQAFVDVSRKGTTAECLRADHAFHRSINEISENVIALEFLDRLTLFVHGQRIRTGYGAGERIQRIISEHDALVNALEGREEVLMEAVVHQHLEAARHDLIDLMSRSDTATTDSGP